ADQVRTADASANIAFHSLGAYHNHQHSDLRAHHIHQVVIVSVFFNVAIVVERPSSGPHLYYLEPISAVVESPIVASTSPYSEMMFTTEAGAEFFRCNPLALSRRLLLTSALRRRLFLRRPVLFLLRLFLRLFFLLLLLLLLLLFILLRLRLFIRLLLLCWR